MADVGIRGAPLRKAVGKAKKRDMNFAYCPGNDVKEDVFTLHEKKRPANLGRDARTEGTGTNICFGTAKVNGRVIALTCDKALRTKVAPKLKKFLKSEAISMNVVVLDADGNPVD